MAYENTDGGADAGSCGEPGASDSMRAFGAFVHASREHAGLGRKEFAALVHFSKHTAASVELGRRTPDRGFVERAEEAAGNTGALRRTAPRLSRQAGLASRGLPPRRRVPGTTRTGRHAAAAHQRPLDPARRAADYVREVAPGRLVQIHEIMLSRTGQESTARFLSPAALTEAPLTIVPEGDAITV